jgi:hypothetical protein
MTHWDRTADKTSGHLQIQPPQRNELTKFAKKKKNRKETETHKDKEEEMVPFPSSFSLKLK